MITMGRIRTEPTVHGTAAVLPPGTGLLAPRDRIFEIRETRTENTSSRSRTPWWLWPHLLSLDAPLVALAWQDWWGRAGGTSPSIDQRVILGLGVWMIYLADRLADTARGLPGDSSTARHAFAGGKRVPLLTMVVVIALALVILAPRVLSVGQFRGGMVLLAAATAYFWLIHRGTSQRWASYLPKEAAVGVMFTLGTCFFALCRPSWPSGTFVTSVVLFGLLCFLNCALITSWEQNACDRRDPFSFLNAFPRMTAHGLQPTCWLLASAAGAAGFAWHTTLFLPVTLSACALGMLDRWKRRMTPDVLRSLADAVLLTPCICPADLAALR